MLFRRFVCEHKLATILAVGIFVRLILMPISGHFVDIYVWYATVEAIVNNGPLTFPPAGISFFPPLWQHYLLIPVAYVYDWLAAAFSVSPIPVSSFPSALNFYPANGILYVPGMMFNFVVKVPFLISDVLVTLVLFKMVVMFTGKQSLAVKAALLWFLNPYLIWISAGWGMWDSVVVLFCIVSLYFLLTNRFVFSSIFLSLAVATKLFPAMFLLPIAVYFFKTRRPDWVKSSFLYYLVFLGALALIFLPDLGSLMYFVNMFLVPDAGYTGFALANPIVVPIGFGLTYWSLYLPYQRAGFPVTPEMHTVLPIVSLVLVLFSLLLTYRVIAKFSFKNRNYALVTTFLLCILAFFLSYRAICEQWLVWALPFLVILYVGGYVKGWLYWGASFVALLYSVLNSPLPFFFLPLVPWFQSSLLALAYVFGTFDQLRIILLAVLGSLFSLLMLLCVLKLLKNPEPEQET